MLGTLSSKQCTTGVQARRTTWITFKCSLEHEHFALLSDISGKGVFFYSDFLPTLGDQLDFVVEYLTGPDRERGFLGAGFDAIASSGGADPTIIPRSGT